MDGRRSYASSALPWLIALVCLGCGQSRSREEAPLRLPVNVFADTGRGERIRIIAPAIPGDPGEAMVWMAQVKPARPGDLDPPLPDPTPGSPTSEDARPPALEVDPGLKPPILRAAGTLVIPVRPRPASVDLDVRVAEDGTVSDALWAGGSADTALVRAAVGCARGMRFFPALESGRPVAVWCRQRFDFGVR